LNTPVAVHVPEYAQLVMEPPHVSVSSAMNVIVAPRNDVPDTDRNDDHPPLL
jgi:hypothetical protein